MTEEERLIAAVEAAGKVSVADHDRACQALQAHRSATAPATVVITAEG